MSRKHPFTYEEFKSIYSKVPRVTVDLIIKNSNQETLLTLRQSDGWENQWHLPGGTIHLGESAVDAAYRVAKEEVGIDINVDKLLGYIEYPSEVKERGFGYSISLALLCSLKTIQPDLQNLSSKSEFFREMPENTIEEQKIFLKSVSQE